MAIRRPRAADARKRDTFGMILNRRLRKASSALMKRLSSVFAAGASRSRSSYTPKYMARWTTHLPAAARTRPRTRALTRRNGSRAKSAATIARSRGARRERERARRATRTATVRLARSHPQY
eukprot:6415306-Prymnesium_polylepis.1